MLQNPNGDEAHQARTDNTGPQPERSGTFARMIDNPLGGIVIGTVLVMAGCAIPMFVLGLLHWPLVGMSGSGAGGWRTLVSGFLVGLGALGGLAVLRKLEGDGATARPTFPGTPLGLGWGLLGGFAVMTVATMAVALAGGIAFSGFHTDNHLAVWIGVALYGGMTEEALFRGVIQRRIAKRWGTWVAVAITSLLFGFAHFTNPNAGLWPAIAIVLEAGVLLGAAYVVTGRLAASIGLHAGWNFTQGWVYSIPVSGMGFPAGFIATRIAGPDWLTGGAFGLEASVITVAIAGAAGAALLWLAVRRGRIEAPRKPKQALQTNE